MRILTFNLRTSYASGDGPNHWDRRKEYAAETIRDINPDFCGLQEMDPKMWKDLEPLLDEWQVIKSWAQTGKHQNGNGLIVRKGAFEVLGSGQFWLSDTPDHESISFSHEWGPRSVIWAKVRAAEDSFIVAVTHFDTHKDFAVPAAKVALEQLGKAAASLPVFFMGDFNASAGAEAWKSFTDAGFRDSWLDTGQKDGPEIFTFNGFTGHDEPPWGRIDWILHQGPMKAFASDIDRRHRKGVFPSDHFPVYADFK